MSPKRTSPSAPRPSPLFAGAHPADEALGEQVAEAARGPATSCPAARPAGGGLAADLVRASASCRRPPRCRWRRSAPPGCRASAMAVVEGVPGRSGRSDRASAAGPGSARSRRARRCRPRRRWPARPCRSVPCAGQAAQHRGRVDRRARAPAGRRDRRSAARQRRRRRHSPAGSPEAPRPSPRSSGCSRRFDVSRCSAARCRAPAAAAAKR